MHRERVRLTVLMPLPVLALLAIILLDVQADQASPGRAAGARAGRPPIVSAPTLLAALDFQAPPTTAATPSSSDSAVTRAPRPPDKIFAASCATCHGANGLGEHESWVLPGVIAPRIALGLSRQSDVNDDYYRMFIRNGSYRQQEGGFTNSMPAFGPEELSNEEMEALITWLSYASPIGGSDPRLGVPPPPRPAGHEIVVRITDDDPWYHDDGSDLRDPDDDPRRVVMSPGDYLKVVNEGRTWHTVTNSSLGVDTGFIGFAGNIPEEETGYYYLELSDLSAGAWKYICKLHPYMQLQIVTPDADPKPLTHVSKMPLEPPVTAGIGELWVGLQTMSNEGECDGGVEVFDTRNWTSTRIEHIGNSPHNGWIGTTADAPGKKHDVVVYANWHDTTVTVIDADMRQALGSYPVGAAVAHVMTAPNNPDPATGTDRWFVTVMGSNKIQELAPWLDLEAGEPGIPAISQQEGASGRPAMSPHGIWFMDDGTHFVTADTLAGKVSLYSTSAPWVNGAHSGIGREVAQLPTGGSTPLAATVMNTGDPASTRYRVYVNNAGTDDISLFDADTRSGRESLKKVILPPPLGNAAGNLALTNLDSSPIRWAHMPIQCPISPPDGTAHGRYMVVANKASLNVSIVSLDSKGDPKGIYTFPAGLGAHGVTFGRKATTSSSPRRPAPVAYYAYVTNTFENHVSVYDLEVLEQNIRLEQSGTPDPAFLPGAATERVHVEGYAAQLLTGDEHAEVPVTLFSPDARGLVHVGDLPLGESMTMAGRAYLQEYVMVNVAGYGRTLLDLEVTTDTGAMGIFTRPLPPPWGKMR